jgi:hypothetical protein
VGTCHKTALFSFVFFFCDQKRALVFFGSAHKMDAWLWERVLDNLEQPNCRQVCKHWNQYLRTKVLHEALHRAKLGYGVHQPHSDERLLAADRRFCLEFLKSDRTMTCFPTNRPERWLEWAARLHLNVSIHASMVLLNK